MHELVPEVPFRHGHAISIDMAYSATLANTRGILSDTEHKRILGLFSRAGLSMDHHQFNEDLLDKATKAILKTRDGKLRAAVPSPLGRCVFLNDVSMQEMHAALRQHKATMQEYPRQGAGIEAFVDASDTGYTMNKKSSEEVNGHHAANGAKQSIINDDVSNGICNDGGPVHDGEATSDPTTATKHASGPEGVDGLSKASMQNGVTPERKAHASNGF